MFCMRDQPHTAQPGRTALLAEGQDKADLATGFVFPNFPQINLDTHIHTACSCLRVNTCTQEVPSHPCDPDSHGLIH